MQLSKIILPVDFSERSAGAAHYAKALALRFHAELIVTHTFELREAIPKVEAGIPPRWYEDQREQAERDLQRFQVDELRDLPVRRVLLDGDVARAIVSLANSEKAGLIVMPTHGYGIFRRFILGSVTAKVLHDADCPVLTGVHIEETGPLGPTEFREIVCAVDFDEAGERAFRWAADFAKETRARLTLVHALPSFPITDVAEYDQTLPNMFRDVARQKAEEMQRLVGAPAEVVLYAGAVAKVVHQAATVRKADLVVIGRHADAGVLGRLRGNAYAIVRESPCPVVSV